jgi:PDZ domain-containing protein/carboxypeptidase family protein
VVDASGWFAVDDLAPGAYRVTATALGRAPAPEVPAQITAEQPAEVQLRVPAGGVAFGTVISRDGGKPLRYARVSVDSETATVAASIAPANASVVTDEQGRFELDGLAPGLRSITVGAFAHSGRIVSGLRVADGARIGPLRIELEPVSGDQKPGLEVVGIGVQLAPSGDQLLIEKVIEGGGAADAGLGAGDAILAVDGDAVTALGFDGTIERIRGVEGTPVRLAIRRGEATLDVTVVRRRIRT